MQEEVTNRTVNLAITTTKLAGRTVLNGIRAYLNHRAKVKTSKAQESPHKQLSRLASLVASVPGRVREKHQERDR